MLTATKKAKIVKKYAKTKGDTGSPEVQIALVTEEINELTRHLKKHKKDNHSRRGLIGMVARRRKLLNYLMKKDEKLYAKIIKDLKLRR